MPDIDLCNFVQHVATILCIVYNSSQNLATLGPKVWNCCAPACLMAVVGVRQHECVSPYFINIMLHFKISVSLRRMSRPRK